MTDRRSHLGIPPGNPLCDSNARTHAQTKTLGDVSFRVTAVDARARNDDPAAEVKLGDLLTADLWPEQERHGVIRTGEREPIPPHVRAAVWFRDQGKCQHCGHQHDGEWHLDHIKPWSAGGSDDTTNLRVLCRQHNLDRSNRVDLDERPKRPATWWCVQCYSASEDERERWRYCNGLPACPIHRDGACRVVQSAMRWHREHGEFPTWHERPFIEAASIVAYCAHCDAPGLTDKPL